VATPVIPATWEAEVGGSSSKPVQSKLVRPYLKSKILKRLKWKSLGSILSTSKKKQKRKEKKE
jgi:hypothetical protein